MPRSTPNPSQPARSTAGPKPVTAAMELLGRRWMLRIVWELRAEPLGARAILGRCDGLSSSVLYQRLRELMEAGLVTQDANDAYRLSRVGANLGAAIEPLEGWAKGWARSAARR